MKHASTIGFIMSIMIMFGWQNSIIAQFTSDNINSIRSIALHPNGITLAMGARSNDEPGIWFYDLATETITGHIATQGNVSALYWRPDGNVIVASVATGEGRTVQVFDVATSAILFEYDAMASLIQVIWSDDGTEFMTPAGNRVLRRDGLTGEMLQTFEFPETNRRSVRGIAWSEQNNRLYATFDVDPEILVWNTITGEIITSFPITFTSYAPEFNHTETLLAVGSNIGDGGILILDSTTGDIVDEFSHDEGGFVLFSPLWSPDDSKILANIDNKIWIWDVTTGQLVHQISLQEHTNSLSTDWTSDGMGIIFSDGMAFPQVIDLALAQSDIE